MSERKIIPIPASTFPTRIEVYYNGELNRTGGVQAGAVEASVKLPAPIEECEIRIIPCDQQGKPVGRGHVYRDESLQPEPPENTDPPADPDCTDDECDGECGEDDCVSSEVEADAAASVVIERAEADEPAVEDAAEPEAEVEEADEDEDDLDEDDFDDEFDTELEEEDEDDEEEVE